jgi:hypothetical protein
MVPPASLFFGGLRYGDDRRSRLRAPAVRITGGHDYERASIDERVNARLDFSRVDVPRLWTARREAAHPLREGLYRKPKLAWFRQAAVPRLGQERQDRPVDERDGSPERVLRVPWEPALDPANGGVEGALVEGRVHRLRLQFGPPPQCRSSSGYS